VIGTLAVDGWAVTFGTATRGLGGLRPHPGPSGAVDGWAVTFGTARRGLGGLGLHPVSFSLYQM